MCIARSACSFTNYIPRFLHPQIDTQAPIFPPGTTQNFLQSFSRIPTQ